MLPNIHSEILHSTIMLLPQPGLSCRAQLAAHMLLAGPGSRLGAGAVEEVEGLLCSPEAWSPASQQDQAEPSSSSSSAAPEHALAPQVLDRCAGPQQRLRPSLSLDRVPAIHVTSL